jgi:ATP-dependent Clp protease protease subunit
MHYTMKESDNKDKAEGKRRGRFAAAGFPFDCYLRRDQPGAGEKVITQMILLQSVSNDPIKLYINSQGGHVEAGDTIHDFIKFIRPEVHVIGTGWVASAGITIFLAAKKEHRYSLPNTRL